MAAFSISEDCRVFVESGGLEVEQLDYITTTDSLRAGTELSPTLSSRLSCPSTNNFPTITPERPFVSVPSALKYPRYPSAFWRTKTPQPTMSWQAYVDSSLVASGHIDKACIASAAGDSVWATSPGFTVKDDELKNIATILEQTGKGGPAVDKAFSEGVHVAGERYVAFNVEDKHIYGRQGKSGVCIVKTNQAIIIGHYGENVQAGNATQTVQALADYLAKSGY
ncbi:hypothetical protein VTH06DRAFT_2045 [Thermothelomyces fergusii]